jgi:hypothetical protein
VIDFKRRIRQFKNDFGILKKEPFEKQSEQQRARMVLRIHVKSASGRVNDLLAETGG